MELSIKVLQNMVQYNSRITKKCIAKQYFVLALLLKYILVQNIKLLSSYKLLKRETPESTISGISTIFHPSIEHICVLN